MSDTNTENAQAPSLEARELEALASGIEAEHAQETAQVQEQAQPQAQALSPEIIGLLSMLPRMALFALRDRIAVNLPEIRAHWTDEVLSAPAQVLPELLQGVLARWAPAINSNPTATRLVVACLPLGLGYFMASQQAQARQTASNAPRAADAPPVAAVAALPAPVPEVAYASAA